ncbi:hypothetical protein GUJ93_ZPchr0012g19783 [Zizania palustris]|uniref:Uncharacterized protein n=1 Tax=Zizania palustris TaxID=103762 RepID=A0A8J5WIK0_ZIZPA|nr:hypothetical protein GUJ93_ZPchr0012g19783 [Zizania palustris]
MASRRRHVRRRSGGLSGSARTACERLARAAVKENPSCDSVKEKPSSVLTPFSLLCCCAPPPPRPFAVPSTGARRTLCSLRSLRRNSLHPPLPPPELAAPSGLGSLRQSPPLPPPEPAGPLLPPPEPSCAAACILGLRLCTSACCALQGARRDSEDEVEVQEDDDENEDDDFIMDDEDVDDYGEVPHSDNHEGNEENLENTLGDFNLDDDDDD